MFQQLGLQLCASAQPQKDQMVVEERPCCWREDETSVLYPYLEKAREETSETKLKRTKISPKKLNDMIARWILTLVSNHTHHKFTNEPLPSIVYKERLKTAKGVKAATETQILTLIDSLIRLKSFPRVALFAKVCGIFPDEGYPLYSSGAKVLVYLIKHCFGMQTSSLERLEEEGTCWLSADAADSCLQNFYESNSHWTLEKWFSSCDEYGVHRPWTDTKLRLQLAADLASIMTTVGEIDAKDRRRLPGDIRGAGLTQVIIDADRLMDTMYSAWVKERSRVYQELESAEQHRIKVLRRMQQEQQLDVRKAQDRPFTEAEKHYLKKGVVRHGLSFDKILSDERYVLVHRTEKRLAEEWGKISRRRKARETKRWNWRRWPWNSEWEWGGLKVGDESVGGEEEFDIWGALESQGCFQSDDDDDVVASDSTYFSDSSDDGDMDENSLDDEEKICGAKSNDTFITSSEMDASILGNLNNKKAQQREISLAPSASAPAIGEGSKKVTASKYVVMEA